jgi:hypothetical protein
MLRPRPPALAAAHWLGMMLSIDGEERQSSSCGHHPLPTHGSSNAHHGMRARRAIDCLTFDVRSIAQWAVTGVDLCHCHAMAAMESTVATNKSREGSGNGM